MLNFIYNPVAGKGKAQRFRMIIEEMLKARGVSYLFWETGMTGDGARLARELSERGEKNIVAMGGDGTLHEVFNGIVDPSAINLGLIPCGSGNDFAAVAGIPTTAEGALEVLLNNPPKPTDYMDCSGVRGLNIIGAGIDVDILRYSNQAKVLKGSLNYFVSLLRAISHFEFYRFDSRFNGQERHHNGLIVCACNGTRFGGGIKICPDARIDDGLLDIVIVEGLTKKRIPWTLVQLAREKILQEKITLHERAGDIRAVFSKPAAIEIDGEIYENLPYDVRIIPGGMMLYR
ncbi:MAG: diacylglycerol kinase family protein [Christensenellales bacterium]|nr:diacylglycerol kinase family protein [Christensenellales bacterium]